MGTPFKLKSGNTSSFKSIGSSPVKQTGVVDAKRLQSKMPKGWDVAKKASSRYVNPNIAKQLTKKATSRTLGKLATGVVRKGASRVLGGPASLVAGLAYGAYKSGQKHSGGKAVKGQKSFMAESKKKTKSIYKKK